MTVPRTLIASCSANAEARTSRHWRARGRCAQGPRAAVDEPSLAAGTTFTGFACTHTTSLVSSKHLVCRSRRLAVDSEWVLVDEFSLKSWGATETPLTLTTGFRPSDDLETTAWSLRDRSWRVQSTWPPCLVEISGCIAKPPRETAIIVLPGLAKKLITFYGTCPGDDHLHSHS
jgi:hypothetical protein